MALSLDGTTGITSDGGTPVIENLDTTATGIAVTGELTATGNVGIGTTSPTAKLTVSATTASDAVRITQTGSGNAFVVEDNTSPDSSPFVIDTGGRVIVGATTALTYSSSLSITPNLQLNAAGAASSGISRFSGNTSGNSYWFLKSRGTTVGDFTAVASGDTLGTIGFLGADGTGGIQAAGIAAVVDGTPSTNDMPGRLVFSTTADGSSSPTERMRITSDGSVGIGTNSPSTTLDVTTTSATPLSVNRSDTGSASIKVSNSTHSTYFGTRSGGGFAIDDDANLSDGPWLLIDNDGNVGIGSTSPASKLHITGSGSIADNCFNVSTPANDNVLLGANLVVDASGTYTKPATSISGAGILFEGINGLNNHGSIQFLSAPDDNTGSATPLERMRIDSSGNLLVGTTSPPTTGRIALYSNSTRTIVSQRAATTSNSHIGFYNPNGEVGAIYTNASSTIYSTSSDYRLKNTIAPMTGALARVSALNPCTYKWNADGSDGEGFIAHELAEVVPQCVTGEKDAVDAEGNPVYQGIDTSFLVATLTAAIQEQQAIIDDLTARVSALEATNV